MTTCTLYMCKNIEHKYDYMYMCMCMYVHGYDGEVKELEVRKRLRRSEKLEAM